MYVDDFKMAGNEKHLNQMWKTLGAKINLDPPVPLDGHVYLGCSQHEYQADKELVGEKSQYSHLSQHTWQIKAFSRIPRQPPKRGEIPKCENQ